MSAWVCEAKRCDLIAYLHAHVTPELCAFVGVPIAFIKQAMRNASDAELRDLVKACERFHVRRGVA